MDKECDKCTPISKHLARLENKIVTHDEIIKQHSKEIAEGKASDEKILQLLKSIELGMESVHTQLACQESARLEREAKEADDKRNCISKVSPIVSGLTITLFASAIGAIGYFFKQLMP